MSQYRRLFIPGGSYFFTVVTYDRKPLLCQAPVIQKLRQAFCHVQQKFPFFIEAIVVLPDHLHCIWRLPEGDSDFSKRWQHIKQFVSLNIQTSRNHRREKTVWQRRYWEHALRNEKDWQKHIDYIYYNPVKHGYTTRPLDWPYSSFKKAVVQGWYPSNWGASEPLSIAAFERE